MQVLKPLQEVVVISITHKNIVHELIKMMIPKNGDASTSQHVEWDKVRKVEE